MELLWFAFVVKLSWLYLRYIVIIPHDHQAQTQLRPENTIDQNGSADPNNKCSIIDLIHGDGIEEIYKEGIK